MKVFEQKNGNHKKGLSILDIIKLCEDNTIFHFQELVEPIDSHFPKTFTFYFEVNNGNLIKNLFEEFSIDLLNNIQLCCNYA